MTMYINVYLIKYIYIALYKYIMPKFLENITGISFC